MSKRLYSKECGRLPTWNDELFKLIRKTWRIGQTFTIEDIYDYEDYFAVLFPKNHNIKAKLRQTLQYLRNHDILEFIDDTGHYRRLM